MASYFCVRIEFIQRMMCIQSAPAENKSEFGLKAVAGCVSVCWLNNNKLKWKEMFLLRSSVQPVRNHTSYYTIFECVLSTCERLCEIPAAGADYYCKSSHKEDVPIEWAHRFWLCAIYLSSENTQPNRRTIIKSSSSSQLYKVNTFHFMTFSY